MIHLSCTGRHFLSRRKIHLLISCLLILTLTSCDNSEPAYHHRFLGFGTIIEVTIYGTDPVYAQKAINDIEEDIAIMHSTWHPREQNTLNRMNLLFETTEWFSAAPSVKPLILKSIELSRSSQHLFNPAIGELIELWGFSQEDRDFNEPPPEPQISALVSKQPQMTDIMLKGITIRSNNPALRLNFGAIAKGYAIDKNIEHLRSLNINNAIINAGGDLRAIGNHGDRPWIIGIRDPRNEGVFASLKIQEDESVFTSGDYERYFEHQGKRYHHIIDPRTGFPAEGTMSVTVIHSDAATADAASTALFIAGKDHWHSVARNMGIKYVMLIDSKGTVHMNPAMRARIHFETGKTPTINLSKPL